MVSKRFLDMMVPLTFICTLFPFFYVVLGAAIKLTSTGLVLLRQQCSGLGNKPFTCLKSHTIVTNDKADILQATDNDKRITSIGHLLRRASLDEFPQFINILEGDTSIIGPRPHVLYHTEIYLSCIPGHMRRLLIKPDITGLAQILDYRGGTPMPADMAWRMRLGLWYIEHRSFSLDLCIFIHTPISFLGVRLL